MGLYENVSSLVETLSAQLWGTACLTGKLNRDLKPDFSEDVELRGCLII